MNRMMNRLIQPEDLSLYTQVRDGETRLGQRLPSFAQGQSWGDTLKSWQQSGMRFVLLGVPEDLGPRANLGQGGAELAWEAFLGRFCNLQWHDDYPELGLQQLAVLGRVSTVDLLEAGAEASPTQLRQLVAALDLRVAKAVQAVFAANLVPIVIGGGHNNALPILRAWHAANNTPASVINLDPHADTRPLEGRHSGNPFSYALQEQRLARYAVIGLNKLKNSAQTLAGFKRYRCADFSLAQLKQALNWVSPEKQPIGLELDLDVIANMPSSAQSAWGVSIAQAADYLSTVANYCQPLWLHLAEGAPALHPAGISAGKQVVGDGLCQLLAAFLAAHASALSHHAAQSASASDS